MNLLIMGLPGAGKGTQASRIVKEFGLIHISTGDMFRSAMANKTEMGMLAKSFIDKGDLVPDEVTNGIVKDRLSETDVKEHGFLLDGYPRTLEQAHALKEILETVGLQLDGVINIEIASSKLIERLSGRIIHRETGETFHKLFNPPAEDYDEADYYQREDDKPESVARRLEVNMTQGQPIIDYYQNEGIVKTIDGDQDIELVFDDVKIAIASLK